MSLSGELDGRDGAPGEIKYDVAGEKRGEQKAPFLITIRPLMAKNPGSPGSSAKHVIAECGDGLGNGPSISDRSEHD